jgi:pSer/pThr/pTyr-binding forkhead associated (FHA) protein
MLSGQEITLRDLGSANGTYLNNQRITEEELSPGDHIVIGPVVFTVRINGDPADVRPVHTRLEARSGAEVSGTTSANVTAKRKPEAEEKADDVGIEDEEDPISALEALANSDDTAALDLDDSSFFDTEDSHV